MRHRRSVCWDGPVLTGPVRPHEHTLPTIPVIEVSLPTAARQIVHQTNAVAQCAGCGVVFVSRNLADGWSASVYWIELKWWHRAAQRKLRDAS